jgi:hypothetical protein
MGLSVQIKSDVDLDVFERRKSMLLFMGLSIQIKSEVDGENEFDVVYFCISPLEKTEVDLNVFERRKSMLLFMGLSIQ